MFDLLDLYRFDKLLERMRRAALGEAVFFDRAPADLEVSISPLIHLHYYSYQQRRQLKEKLKSREPVVLGT